MVVFFLSPISPIDVGGDANTPAGFCRQLAFFREWAAIPVELLENDPLDVTAGPATADGCVAVRPTTRRSRPLGALGHVPARGLLHLAGNMLFLFVFGNNVEDRLGRARYLFFYLACGYVATYGFALSDPTSTDTLVGASGAIAGVLGAYLILFPSARVTSLVPFLFFIPVWLPGLGRARLLVRAPVALLPGRRHRRGRRRGLPGPRRRVRRRRGPDPPPRRPPRPPPAVPAPPGTTSGARVRRGRGPRAGRCAGSARNPRRARNGSAPAGATTRARPAARASMQAAITSRVPTSRRRQASSTTGPSSSPRSRRRTAAAPTTRWSSVLHGQPGAGARRRSRLRAGRRRP